MTHAGSGTTRNRQDKLPQGRRIGLSGLVLAMPLLFVAFPQGRTPGTVSDDAAASEALLAVDSINAASVWAVGYTGGIQSTSTLVQHWDGRIWTTVKTQAAPKGQSWRLLGVSGDSDLDVWAVGDRLTDSGTRALIEHWDGQRFTQSAIPRDLNPSDLVTLSSVTTISPKLAWAAGTWRPPGTNSERSLVLRWDGTRWTHSDLHDPARPSRILTGIDNLTTSRVVAVGSTQRGSQLRTLVEVWNGRSWHQAPSDNPGRYANGLNAVTMIGPGDGWAVGEYYPDPDSNLKLIEHLDHGVWRHVSGPNLGGNTVLSGVSGSSSDDVWAVGTHQDFSNHMVILHWNGQHWTIYRQEPESNGSLRAITTLTATDAWAVGFTDHVSHYETAHEHWDGHSWTPL